jgi:hypothetical protein
MIRKFKMLGMALVAVLALTAVVASAASAASYTASSYPTTGTGESAVGNGIITTEAGKVECRTHFEATLTAASSQLTAKAQVSECKAFGFLNATVSMGSCDYVFNQPQGSGDSYTATTNVACGSGSIMVTAGTCKLTIGSQGPLSKVELTNNTALEDVFVKLGITGIAYTVVTDGIGCPFIGTGAKTGATSTYHSAVTFDSTNGAVIHIG